MLRPERRITGGGWFRVFGVALLATAAAVLWIAQPVVANAGMQEIPVKEKDGTPKIMKVTYDDWLMHISATVDGKPVKVSEPKPYPIKLGNKPLTGVYGPAIVFEGSTCVLIGGRWIGYPPGTPCP